MKNAVFTRTVRHKVVDGHGWSLGQKIGCSSVTNGAGHVTTVCGCSEKWAPVGLDGDLAKNGYAMFDPRDTRITGKKMFSAEVLVGCYKREWATGPDMWQPNCRVAHQQTVALWETLVF